MTGVVPVPAHLVVPFVTAGWASRPRPRRWRTGVSDRPAGRGHVPRPSSAWSGWSVVPVVPVPRSSQRSRSPRLSRRPSWCVPAAVRQARRSSRSCPGRRRCRGCRSGPAGPARLVDARVGPVTVRDAVPGRVGGALVPVRVGARRPGRGRRGLDLLRRNKNPSVRTRAPIRAPRGGARPRSSWACPCPSAGASPRSPARFIRRRPTPAWPAAADNLELPAAPHRLGQPRRTPRGSCAGRGIRLSE